MGLSKTSETHVPHSRGLLVQSLSKELSDLNVSEPEDKKPIVMMGSSGNKLTVACNYIRLKLEQGKGVFEYEVKYKPPVVARKMQYYLLNKYESIIGATKTFDGVILYLPFQLPDKVTTIHTNLPTDNSNVTIEIIFKKKKVLGETIHLYNVLFRQIMNVLGLALLGRHFFDASSAMPIPAHKLEVWPGYITAVDEYEGGIMLCCDASHRILRTQTVYNLLEDLMSVHRNWKDEFLKLIIGQNVLTRYNNKIYKVDDVDFDGCPMSTFDMTDGSKVSYFHYYLKHYNLTIHDKQQPLIVSRRKVRVMGKEMSSLVCLVPELCYLTGLTDSLKSDMKVMKDIAMCTRITPVQRDYALKRFINNVNSNVKAKSILDSWGLRLEDGLVQLEGRKLHPEAIYFGNKQCIKGHPSADWCKAFNTMNVLSSVDLHDWFIVCLRRDEKTVSEFVELLKKCAPPVGMAIGHPRIVTVADYASEQFVRSIRQNSSKTSQMVVIIFPSARNDMYSAVKKLCCSEIGIASQVIQTRTIRRADKLRSVVQKIALQMNCKLGGTLWAVEIPMKNTMVCGIDTYHDPSRRGKSVAALVTSLNKPLTRWYSKIYKQAGGKELMDGLTSSLLACIMKYNEVNGYFPEQIIIFRDGVGDGQLLVCKEFECTQLFSCCSLITPNYKPKFLFVVVQKRINTRVFVLNDSHMNNPLPGTVVDHTITRRDWYDFFLVSQNVRHGTVSPTHYVVIHNSTKMSPDQVQILSYKLTHLYYNWPGTIRVPAPCQYAHKLAFLVGESTQKEACETLCDKLYFL